MIIRKVCAWCNTTTGLLIDPVLTRATHGACRPCADRQLAEWKARKAA